MRYYKFPKWLKWFYPGAIWDFSFSSKAIFLTFDDGPHPETTPGLLDLLDNANIKATFFCLGKNVEQHPELYQEILDRGHIVGNHSSTHPKGIKTPNQQYVKDVLAAKDLISSNLFRPPYGKIKPAQYKLLKDEGFQTVFWSIMPYDFDQNLTADDFIIKMTKLAFPGAIYVFHDNVKAKKVIENELGPIIASLKQKGYHFQAITPELFS